jgi:hypothetical protein
LDQSLEQLSFINKRAQKRFKSCHNGAHKST